MSTREDHDLVEESRPTEEVEEENEDPTVCDICLDGEVYENNEILFCDSCDVAVHQLCYGVKTIPEGAWFCYVCAKGLKPAELQCELCSYKGGAYKPIDKKNKWTHGLCPMWIPELFEKHSPSEPPTWQFQYLDKRRYNLKCALCKTKGACVQCSYGRCTTAVHPWCALRTPQGFTRRIIKDDEGEPHWEIFCKAHAKAVSDPVKKSAKNKHQSHTSAALFEDHEIYWEDPDAPPPVHPQGRRQSAGQSSSSSAAHANATPAASAKPSVTLNLVEDIGDDADIVLKDDDEDDQMDSDDDDKPSGLAGALQENSASSFPTLSLLEWPGLSEGDGMDLDHFWNFTSSFFAEDHTKEWFKFMKNGANRAVGRFGDSKLESLPLATTNLKNASREALEDALEEVNEAFASERNRSSALYYEKRNRFLDDVERTLDLLAACDAENTHLLSSLAAEQSKVDTESDGKDSAASDATSSVLAAAKSKLFAYYQHKRFSYDDEFAFVPDAAAASSTKAQHQPASKEETSSELKVIFDGSTRFSATFSVVDTTPDESPPSIDGADPAAASKSLLYPVSNEVVSPDSVTSLQKALRLEAFEPIAYDKTLVVQGKPILAKDDISILQRLIVTDYHAYLELVDHIHKRLERAMRLAEAEDASGKEVALYESSKDIHMTYVKQQVWKWICSSMHNGVRDQKPGAYKTEEEALPASWTIQVPGRPAAPSKADDDEEKEAHEDIVCMCCFDGSFAEDRNQILFCDGCNATMHQKCYGIAEIPEGHFYCDRCAFVQRQYHDDDVDESFLKNAVRCSLCPLYHGGLKRTTDKRWVHLCCALFTGEHTSIHNLTKMSHIDISNVPLQNEGRPMVMPKMGHTTSTRFAPHPDACIYCHAYGGYVVSCQHTTKTTEEEEGSPCSVKFHPLCAWFAGGCIHSEIADPSFQGKSRQGHYPSGLSFRFLCAQHDHETRHEQAEAIRSEQITIRSKYRINELDLTVMPGKNNKRKHRRQTKKERNGGSGGSGGGGGTSRGTAAAAQVQKELAPDHYTDKLCAICMKPTTDDLFGSGYDSQVMSAIALDFDPLPTVTDISNSSTSDENGHEESGSGSGISDSSSSSGGGVSEIAVKTEVSVEEATRMDVVDGDDAAVTVAPGTPTKTAASDATAPATTTATPTHQVTASSSSSSSVAMMTTTASPRPKAVGGVAPASASASEHAHRVISCQQCGIVVHMGCLHDFAPAAVAGYLATPPTPWLCMLCATNSDVLTMSCALCPRHGGVFCPTVDQTMVHPYCARTLTSQMSIVDGEYIDMKQHVKEANRKQKCGICNRKKGLCLPCHEVGCTVYFHPLCGIRSGKGFVRNSASYCSSSSSSAAAAAAAAAAAREACCQDHIPPGVEMSSTGFWIDGYELGHLRRSLDRARIVLDMVVKREKFKKMICKSELDLFQHRWQKALARATGKKAASSHLHPLDERDHILQLDDSSEASEYVYSDGDDGDDAMDEEIDAQFQLTHGDKFVLLPDFPQQTSGKKYEALPFVHPKTGETVFISPTWTKYGEIRRPKNMRIAFAGHQLFPRDIVGLNQKSFVKLQLEKVHRLADETRVYSGIFAHRKEEETFGKKLLQDLYRQSQMTDKELVEYLRENAPFLELPRVGVQRRSSSTTTATAKGGRRGSEAAAALALAPGVVHMDTDDDDDDVGDDGGHGRVVVAKGKKGAATAAAAKATPKGKAAAATTGPARGRPSRRQVQDDDNDTGADDDDDFDADAMLVDSDDSDADRGGGRRGRRSSASHRKRRHSDVDVDADEDGAAAAAADEAPRATKKAKGAAATAAAATSAVAISGPHRAYQQSLDEIRALPSYQEFRKHFHHETAATTSTKRRTAATAAPTGTRVGGGGGFKAIYDAALVAAAAEGAGLSTQVPSDTAVLSDVYRSIHDRSSPAFIALERILFHVHDSLGLLEDTHPETLAALAEERAAQALLSPKSRASAKEQKKNTKKPKNQKTRGGARGRSTRAAAAAAAALAANGRGDNDDDGDVDADGEVDAEDPQQQQQDGDEEEDDDEEKPQLIDEYDEIPYEDLPNYDEFVRRPVCFQAMRTRLQAHLYTSIAAYAADFYTLMNNARVVATMTNTRIRDNTKRLAEQFERLVWDGLQYSGEDDILEGVTTNYEHAPLRYVPTVGGNRLGQWQEPTTGEVVSMRCSHCHDPWYVGAWPEAFTVPTQLLVSESGCEGGGGEDDSGTGSGSGAGSGRPQRKPRRSWATGKAAATAAAANAEWFCRACVISQGHELIGRPVRVWWRGDGCAYAGRIDGYDPRAQCHRILYDVDQEWEFVSLALEPYLFSS